MPAEQCVNPWSRDIVLIVMMTVREHDPGPVGHKDAVVTHAGEPEKHLVNLGVAIAPDGDNPFSHRVQPRRNSRGINAFRNSVPGPVVQDISEAQEHIVIFAFKERESFLQSRQ